MKNVRILIPILILAGLSAPPARPEEKRLSLEECLDLALKNNSEVALARQALEAARGRRLQAAALPNPVLSLSAEGLPFKKNGGEKEWNAGVEELIEFPGKRALRQSIGRYDEDAAALDLERAKSLAAARVKRAYYQAAASEQRLRLLDEAGEDLKSYSALAQARYAALQTSPVDVSRGMIEELKLKVETVEAHQSLRADLASLSLVMGVASDDSVPLLEDIRFAPPDVRLEEVLRRVQDRPSLKADALRTSQAQAGIDLARKSALPDFTLGLLYPSLRPESWGISLGTTIPLFAAKRTGEVVEARAAFGAKEATRRARRTRIETSVRTLFSEMTMLREKLELYDASLLRESERLIQSALRDYQYGKLDSLGLLDLYRTWRDVNRQRLDTLLRYVQVGAEIEVAGEDTAVEE